MCQQIWSTKGGMGHVSSQSGMGAPGRARGSITMARAWLLELSRLTASDLSQEMTGCLWPSQTLNCKQLMAAIEKDGNAMLALRLCVTYRLSCT
jgi:hypothetical protein